MAQLPITPSDGDTGSDLRSRNDLFISYSRKDKAFVEQLAANFQQAGRDPWVDWEDIYKGEDWWKSIQQGIAAADSFLFVISPDSVLSDVCRQEIDYATQLNKRFLPLLWREGFEMDRVHPSISRHNWIFSRETDDSHQAFQELLKALDTDIDYVHAHTRLLLRSLEWQARDQDSSYLLRGRDLEDARTWLNQGLNTQPRPTEGQVAYINAGLDAQAAALKARQKAKWVVVLTTVLANLAFVAAGLSILYWRMNSIAQRQVEKTMQETLAGALKGIDGDEFAKLAQVKLPAGKIEPVGNPLYEKHQAWLQTVHQIAPKALPTTYIQDATLKLVTIGDICRVIYNPAEHPFRMIIPGEEIIPARLEGFKQVSVNLSPFRDKFGKSWVSIYGPIKNRAGVVVGQLGLAYDSTYWTDLEDKIIQMMTIACIVAIVWLTISSWLILRATAPPSVLPSKDAGRQGNP